MGESKGKSYGTEFSTLMRASNIKFVRYNDAKSAKTPMETMTKGRVYTTVNDANKITSITYYDEQGKRKKQIDLLHEHNGKIKGHVHKGYFHDEYGTSNPTPKEKKLIEFVKKTWLNSLNK